jgi:hypothetical protein
MPASTPSGHRTARHTPYTNKPPRQPLPAQPILDTSSSSLFPTTAEPRRSSSQLSSSQPSHQPSLPLPGSASSPQPVQHTVQTVWTEEETATVRPSRSIYTVADPVEQAVLRTAIKLISKETIFSSPFPKVGQWTLMMNTAWRTACEKLRVDREITTQCSKMVSVVHGVVRE